MPRLTLIAGPDGAGKSTLARQAGFDGPFVNADDIARAINPEASEAAAAAAGRETLAQLAALIHERRDVVHETTLAGINALRVIDRAKVAGYTIEAVFVAVPSADLAIGRVAQRTAAGGRFRPRTCGAATSAASTTCPGWLRARTSRQSTTIRRKTGRWWRGSRGVTSPSGDLMRPMTCTCVSRRPSRLACLTGPILSGRSRGRRTAAHELPAGTMPPTRR